MVFIMNRAKDRSVSFEWHVTCPADSQVSDREHTRAQCYKSFVMLNSVESDIATTHRYLTLNIYYILLFKTLKHSDVVVLLLINVQMPTIGAFKPPPPHTHTPTHTQVLKAFGPFLCFIIG